MVAMSRKKAIIGGFLLFSTGICSSLERVTSDTFSINCKQEGAPVCVQEERSFVTPDVPEQAESDSLPSCEQRSLIAEVEQEVTESETATAPELRSNSSQDPEQSSQSTSPEQEVAKRELAAAQESVSNDSQNPEQSSRFASMEQEVVEAELVAAQERVNNDSQESEAATRATSVEQELIARAETWETEEDLSDEQQNRSADISQEVALSQALPEAEHEGPLSVPSLRNMNLDGYDSVCDEIPPQKISRLHLMFNTVASNLLVRFIGAKRYVHKRLINLASFGSQPQKKVTRKIRTGSSVSKP